MRATPAFFIFYSVFAQSLGATLTVMPEKPFSARVPLTVFIASSGILFSELRCASINDSQPNPASFVQSLAQSALDRCPNFERMRCFR